MIKGLVFGKFMPLHKGHLALIDFALNNCDHLTILLCYTKDEPIEGIIRKQWLDHEFENDKRCSIKAFEYDDSLLPNTSVSSKVVSKKWAEALKQFLPGVDILFTSEQYGEYVSEYMNIKHRSFDKDRSMFPVSGSQIREYPFKYWDLLSEVALPWFVKKVSIVGTESTGKSTLTEKLASHFSTSFVKEMARDIVEVTDECTYDDLLKIAAVHAKSIIDAQTTANKLLFVDTDINITCSYSEFLFDRQLNVEGWIKEANTFDLYLFLEPDCEYVQDGTRLSLDERNKLSDHHKNFFRKKGINVISINGDWQQRFAVACKIVTDTFRPLS